METDVSPTARNCSIRCIAVIVPRRSIPRASALLIAAIQYIRTDIFRIDKANCFTPSPRRTGDLKRAEASPGRILLNRVQAVEIKVQFEDVHSRFAEEPKLSTFRVLRNQSL